MFCRVRLVFRRIDTEDCGVDGSGAKQAPNQTSLVDGLWCQRRSSIFFLKTVVVQTKYMISEAPEAGSSFYRSTGAQGELLRGCKITSLLVEACRANQKYGRWCKTSIQDVRELKIPKELDGYSGGKKFGGKKWRKRREE